MPEIIDIFDDNMQPIGSMERGEAHRIGAWHKTFHCWVVRQENGKDYVLFQRRSAKKRAYPNKLDITAAGHILSGETVEDGVREVSEELGVDVSHSDLQFLGIRTATSIDGDDINREFNHVYLLHRNNPVSAYTLQQDELSSLVQVEVADGLALCTRRVAKVRANGIEITDTGAVRPIDISIQLEDIIPRWDHYYMKIFIMAERYFTGNPDICI